MFVGHAGTEENIALFYRSKEKASQQPQYNQNVNIQPMVLGQGK